MVIVISFILLKSPKNQIPPINLQNYLIILKEVRMFQKKMLALNYDKIDLQIT